MGVQLRMLGTAQVSCLLLVAATAQGQADPEQGAEAPDFLCPEKNGKFRDFEQCDLFYICRNDVATIEFCPEGLLFDDKIPNHEKCVLPHNVDCGDRIYVQEPSPDRDPKCERANGVFNHPDENPLGLKIFCKLIPSTLTPLTADHTFPAITIRSPTSLDAARATCSTLTPRPASPPRRCLSAPAGTGAPRTAGAATSATRTAPAPPSRLTPSRVKC